MYSIHVDEYTKVKLHTQHSFITKLIYFQIINLVGDFSLK